MIAKKNSGEINVSTTSLKLWYERLGHVNQRALAEMIKAELMTGVTTDRDFFCESCQVGKSHRLPFDKQNMKQEQ